MVDDRNTLMDEGLKHCPSDFSEEQFDAAEILLFKLFDAGMLQAPPDAQYTTGELCERYDVKRSTIYWHKDKKGHYRGYTPTGFAKDSNTYLWQRTQDTGRSL